MKEIENQQNVADLYLMIQTWWSFQLLYKVLDLILSVNHCGLLKLHVV